MGEFTTLMARDGHEFQAYLAAPAPTDHATGHPWRQGTQPAHPARTLAADAARPRGAVVVLQEIFGVNGHIRSVTDGFAAEGYTAIAPAMFDRIRRRIELGYTPAEIEEGRGYAQQLKPEEVLKDLAAAVAVVRNSGRVATVGYCWGGAISYRAACELSIAAAVVYYGKIPNSAAKPKCPVLYHFGTEDKSIPLAEVERLKAAHPEGAFYLYEGAGHGFNCDQRATYQPAAAALARRRTLEFLAGRLVGADKNREDDA